MSSHVQATRRQQMLDVRRISTTVSFNGHTCAHPKPRIVSPVDGGASVCSAAGDTMAISVTVAIGDVWASCEIDLDYSPDLLDDLSTQAAAAAVAAAKAVVA